ncbi:MAG: hypothetical protein ACFFEE_07325 [Candidatus Thorarchaeota archaeon]
MDINKVSDASIFEIVDYGTIDDIFTVLPEVIDVVKNTTPSIFLLAQFIML